MIQKAVLDAASSFYDGYRQMRESAAVTVIEGPGSKRYCLTRYHDVSAALRDDRFGAAKAPGPLVAGLRDRGLHLMAELADTGLLVALDPPDHTRLRRVVEGAFRRESIDRLQDRIAALAGELLEDARRKGTFDIMSDFAVPLPTIVIAEVLGVPASDRARLKRWSDDFAPMIDTDLQANGLARCVQTVMEFQSYFAGLVEARRGDRRDDLLSALVAARYDDGSLTDAELLGTTIFLLAAGHETTTHLIGNGALALLLHPGQRTRLEAEPERINSAIEEMLRYDSPIQRTGRVVREKVMIDGTVLPAGASARLMIGSANRDPRRFENPDSFDVTRPDNAHLAFGAGPHYCLGATLARMETRIAITALLEHLPRLRLAGADVEWIPGSKMRGLVSLRVERV